MDRVQETKDIAEVWKMNDIMNKIRESLTREIKPCFRLVAALDGNIIATHNFYTNYAACVFGDSLILKNPNTTITITHVKE